MNYPKLNFVGILVLIFCMVSGYSRAQDSTIYKLKSSLDTARENTVRVDIWVNLAQEIMNTSIDEATKYLDSAEALSEKIEYRSGLANVYKVRGSMSTLEGKYAKALSSLSKALTTYRQTGDSSNMARTDWLLGNVYSSTNNYNEALRYYKNALEYFVALKDSKSVAALNNNVGTIYHIRGNLDSASIFYNKSLLTYLELKDKEGASTNYTNIGNVYADREEYYKAIEYYNQSNGILKQLNQTLGQAVNYLNMGDVYMHLKDYGKAHEYVKRAMNIAEKEGFGSLLTDQYYTVGEIYEAEGKYAKALEWYRKSELMEDSLLNTEAKTALIETQTRALEEAQKRELEKINEINSERLKTEKLKNSLLWVISSSILLLLLVATVYFYKRARVARKIKQQSVQILDQKSKIFDQARSIAEKNDSLLEHNARLEKLNEEKNYLMNVVAHDLKSPLNQIEGLAEVIRLEKGNLSSTQLECLDNIAVSSHRLSKMINRILDARAIDSDSKSYEIKDIKLRPVLLQTITNFAPLAERKQIDIVKPLRLANPTVKGDKHYIQQVLENILSNAIKFTPQGKQIDISIDLEASRAIVSIKDQGPGLTKEDHKNLFNEYAKLSAKPTGDESSTGLGLSIVKKYVGLMGGDVWCESEDGQGANFKVALNLA
ncbi:MAG: tetratricopeptide repeat-containing sensor histidine kinase [Cyclobacteriaceae bacterium]|nr:tetratricopeptide repeat-containing sensor histidine kinase [Cyclobacteriaceae bacterium]